MTRALRLLPLAAVALATCTDAPAPEAERTFPDAFLFGSAIAGFQVDMGCPTVAAEECEDRNSDWYQWITDPRIVENAAAKFFEGGPPSTGPGFYELFPQDLARAKNDLKLGSVRLSIEWSRIFPTATFGLEGHEALKTVASAKGLDYYRRQLAEMKKLGLVPLVTLNHYTLPLWIHDGVGCHVDLDACTERGWLDPRITGEIAKYSGFVAKELGADVDLWATQNEPLAITLAGYLSPGKDRTNPPALGYKAVEAKAVTMAMIHAHARMYDAVKANDTVDADGNGKASEVGIVMNLVATRPADPEDPEDDQGAKNIAYLYNELFLNGTAKGLLDAEANGVTAVLKPELEHRMDYVGVNYYTRITVDGTSASVLKEFSPLLTMNPLSPQTVLWEDYPRGIYEVISFVKDKYALPVIVTENGFSPKKADGTDDEERREKLFAETIQWVHEAMKDGADVRGYFWWSLMDNYEWNHGMDPYRFGLFAVDDESPQKTRTMRPFGATYAKIAQERKIPAELSAKYPIR